MSYLTPLFGANLDPSAHDPQDAFRRAEAAEANGLDLVMMQDHPYNKDHLDTWTVLSMVAARTSRIHVGTNVANVPLRTPQLLAKQAASLDLLTGGRVELGIGAGAFWRGIHVYGAPGFTHKLEARPYTAFKEALDIIRGILTTTSGGFKYEGEIYQVRGMMPGPAPAHPIRIWVGGLSPKMLRLIGEKADGVSLSSPYIPAEQLPEMNRHIDEGTQAAGRDPSEIRHLYNMMGTITARDTVDGFAGKAYRGSARQWANQLIRLYQDYRQDTFVFWETEGGAVEQIKIFANEVVPAVKEAMLV